MLLLKSRNKPTRLMDHSGALFDIDDPCDGGLSLQQFAITAPRRRQHDPCDGRHRVSGKARVPPAGREQPPIQSHVLSLGTDLRDFDQTLTLFQAVLPKTVLIPILRLSDRLLPSRVARWT